MNAIGPLPRRSHQSPEGEGFEDTALEPFAGQSHRNTEGEADWPTAPARTYPSLASESDAANAATNANNHWVVEQLHRDGSVLARWRVHGPRFTMGRALDNDLVLDDAHAAPHHAELQVQNERSAVLHDLGSVNGISHQGGKPLADIRIAGPQTLRVGASLLRVRSAAWALAPELPLDKSRPWLWALLTLGAALLHGVWELWLTDRQADSPQYLYGGAGLLGLLGLWSAAYALYGRLATGVDRFFSHLLIACCGYLGIAAIENALPALAFALGWLWPMQVQNYAIGLALALTVRSHLRLADPRHWRSMRWALALVTLVGISVPLAQQWITSRELTPIHTMDHLGHPAMRLAPAQPIGGFLDEVERLQTQADSARELPARADQDAPEDGDTDSDDSEEGAE